MTKQQKHVRVGRVLTDPVKFQRKSAVLQAGRLAGGVLLGQRGPVVTRSRDWDASVKVHGHEFDPLLVQKQVRLQPTGDISGAGWIPTGLPTPWECIKHGVLTPHDNSWISARQENLSNRFHLENMPAGFAYALGCHAEFRSRFGMAFGAAFVELRIRLYDGGSPVYSKQTVLSHTLPPQNHSLPTTALAPLDETTMNAVELELTSQSNGTWGFAQGLIQVIAVDIVLDYMATP